MQFSLRVLLVAAALYAAAAWALPAESEDGVLVASSAAASAGLVTEPALRVRMTPGAAGSAGPGALAAGGCTDPACHALCQALNWAGGFCLDADWCLCYG